MLNVVNDIRYISLFTFVSQLTLHKQSDCKATNEAENRQTDDDFVHIMKTTGVIVPVQSDCTVLFCHLSETTALI